MCGIAGVLGPADGISLESMLQHLRRRGPDDQGVYRSADVQLGFRRLAIVDVRGGRQPLVSEAGNCVLVCNGEIYNHAELRQDLKSRGHRFGTRSDVEVILHLYEELEAGCLDRLRGMFSFALWDARRRRLLLARDHVGMKPLYYRWDGRRLLFGSQVGSLLASGAVPRRIDARSVERLFVYQAVPGPDTIVEGCRAVEPGTCLLAQCGRPPVARRYWQLGRRPLPRRLSVQDAAARLRELVDRTIRAHLQSEVPLGSFLSGGLDSSAVVASLSREVPRLKTFSVGFEGAGTEGYSELGYARLVAERFGTEHHEAVHTGASVARDLPSMIDAMDQPTTDGINSFLVSQLASRDVTVAFSGTGPDELLLGYSRDAWLWRFRTAHDAVARTPTVMRTLGLRLLRMLPASCQSGGLRHWRSMLEDRHALLRGFFFSAASGYSVLSPAARAALFTSQAGAGRDDDLGPLAELDHAPLPELISRWETQGFAGCVLLPDIDAMSMAHSLEVRVPFYDRDVVELLFSLPAHLKDPTRETKRVLKLAYADRLPAAVLERLKQGFCLPLHLWMADHLNETVSAVLSSATIRQRGIFDPDAIRGYLGRFLKGDTSCWRPLWGIFVVEAWCRRHLDRRPLESLFDAAADCVAERLTA